MKIPRISASALLLLGLLTVSFPLWAEQAKMSTAQRLDRLERMLRNQSMADLVYQMQQLQQEVQRLNGELELQKHALDAMSRRQRDLYLDIDQRLSRLQPGSGATTPPSNRVAPTPTPTAGSPGASIPTASSSVVASAAPVTPPDPKKEAAAYQSAFNLLKQGRYAESIKAFRAFLKDYPGGSYEDNAKYWLGEAGIVTLDYDSALKDFSRVLIDHPKSAKVPGAMLKMGSIFNKQKAWDKAREILQRLQQGYPGTTEARLGEKILQQITKEGH